jgi:hypothetical protein
MGSVPPPGGAGPTHGPNSMPTMDAQGVHRHSSFGPPPGGVPSISNLPPGPLAYRPPPTTQQTWQNTQTGGLRTTGEQRGTSPIIVAVLGVITGLAVLTLVAVAVYFISIRKAETADNPAPPSASTAAAAVPTPTGATPTGPTPTATTTSGARPAGARDAGAVSDAGGLSSGDAGGAPQTLRDAGGGGNKDKEDEERNKQLGIAAQRSCDYHTQQMTLFARDDASRKRAAEQAKSFMCKGFSSSRCERQVCLNACMALGDSQCIQQIRYTIDHGPPPKY